ncbi:Na+/H+ antiporter subunit G [Pseudomonas fulva]|nr:Na+/H+ antiporter subunit G [Pseudomonas fulva]MBF8781063.1 Na+/H+ antiporter subunit G [Pseudomonas fulva]
MNETVILPFWLELVAAMLLLVGSVFAFIGALGLVRLKDYFQRMHPPALASTIGAWCIALASIFYFSGLKHGPVLHAWLIPVLLSMTVPVTTLLLARAALFRKRAAGEDVPEEVSDGNDSGN